MREVESAVSRKEAAKYGIKFHRSAMTTSVLAAGNNAPEWALRPARMAGLLARGYWHDRAAIAVALSCQRVFLAFPAASS